ncbi:VP66 [Reovirus GCRV104]|nr:VP66 [Reovirus GCRV104]
MLSASLYSNSTVATSSMRSLMIEIQPYPGGSSAPIKVHGCCPTAYVGMTLSDQQLSAVCSHYATTGLLEPQHWSNIPTLMARLAELVKGEGLDLVKMTSASQVLQPATPPTTETSSRRYADALQSLVHQPVVHAPGPSIEYVQDSPILDWSLDTDSHYDYTAIVDLTPLPPRKARTSVISEEPLPLSSYTPSESGSTRSDTSSKRGVLHAADDESYNTHRHRCANLDVWQQETVPEFEQLSAYIRSVALPTHRNAGFVASRRSKITSGLLIHDGEEEVSFLTSQPVKKFTEVQGAHNVDMMYVYGNDTDILAGFQLISVNDIQDGTASGPSVIMKGAPALFITPRALFAMYAANTVEGLLSDQTRRIVIGIDQAMVSAYATPLALWALLTDHKLSFLQHHPLMLFRQLEHAFLTGQVDMTIALHRRNAYALYHDPAIDKDTMTPLDDAHTALAQRTVALSKSVDILSSEKEKLTAQMQELIADRDSLHARVTSLMKHAEEMDKQVKQLQQMHRHAPPKPQTASNLPVAVPKFGSVQSFSEMTMEDTLRAGTQSQLAVLSKVSTLTGRQLAPGPSRTAPRPVPKLPAQVGSTAVVDVADVLRQMSKGLKL